MPEEVTVYNERALENKCGDNLEGFTYVNIHCKLNGNRITVTNGFKMEATTNLTDDDGETDPPVLMFDIGQFRNPRSQSETGTFNVTIYSENGKELYIWQTEDEPSIKMDSPATP